ncbi:26S proteasome non-ATPase regulatory subunit 5, partial [Kappamyces sp. JEL0680]
MLDQPGLLEKIAKNAAPLDRYLNWLYDHLSALFCDERLAIRAYDLVAEIATAAPGYLDACQRASLLDFVQNFSPLDDTDILETLALIQLFSQLVEKQAGCDLLAQTFVFPKLAALLIPVPTTDAFVLYACIKFWGMLGYHQATLLKELNAELAVFESLTSIFADDETSRDTKEAILIAVGNVGSTGKGLKLLHEQHYLLTETMNFLPHASGSIKPSALRTLSCLLSNGRTDHIVDAISLSIFNSFASDPLGKLLSLSKSSVEDVAIAALSTMQGVVAFAWGLEALSSSVACIDFLLERRGETPNIIKEWKYAIVQAVFLDPRSRSTFAPSHFERLET